jgi:GNAT superfamily N-acetyltransferase
MWQDRYQTGREPDRTLRIMTEADISAADVLEVSIGWSHDPAVWERLLHWSPGGCFVIEEVDRGIVGTVTTTCYGTTLAWIGKLVVASDRRSMGFGRQLMRAALDYLIERQTERIMLDATDLGRPLYESLGFRSLYNVERWGGRASTYLGPRARRMQSDDVPAVLELDAVLFGLRRKHILTCLLEESPDLAWVDYYRGKLEGYLLGQRTPTGVYLGPWMSWSAASAERLLLIALEQLQGESITLNIPDSNGRALILATNHNFQRIRRCTRMIYGSASPVSGESLAELSVASLATG